MKQHIRKRMNVLKRIMSMMLVSIMMLSIISPYIVSTEQYLASETVVSVAGNFKTTLGETCNVAEDWNKDADSGIMEHLGGNYYYKVITFEETTEEKTLEIKVLINKDWSNSFGNSDANLSVTIPQGKTQMVIVADISGRTISTNCDLDADATILDNLVTVTGNFSVFGFDEETSDWQTSFSDGVMQNLDNGYFYKKITFTELTSEVEFTYKITLNNSWTSAIGADGSTAGDAANISTEVPAGTSQLELIADINNNIVYNSIDNADTIKSILNGTTVKLDQSTLSMKKGETATLTATTSPENATVTWTSSDTSVATVDSGNITALKAGTTTITVATEDGATATCTVKVMVESPVVEGNQVTFNYESSTASNVYLAGTMNGWSTESTPLTNNNGIFTYTVELTPGTYQYKFVVDGTWMADPVNGTTIGDTANSLLIIPGITTTGLSFKKGSTMTLPSELAYLNADGTETTKAVTGYTSATEGVTINDKSITLVDGFTATEFTVTATTVDNETADIKVQIYEQGDITVKIHYDRSDDAESEWNAWVWGDFSGDSDGYAFVEEDGEYVATFTIPAESVYYVNTLKYKIRLGNWLKEEGERQIDLSEVIGGTVHSYVDTSGGYSNVYTEAVIGTKMKGINYERSNNTIVVSASGVIADYENAFTVKKLDGTEIEITGVEQSGTTYTISIAEDISSLVDVTKTYKLTYDGLEYFVTMPNLYKTEEFETAYTYDGDDLGATWTEDETTFKVWAPTADSVKVQLYATGSDEEEGSKTLETYTMTPGEKGVWTVVVEGDLNGVYYTYLTDVNGTVEESCDPYARTTGVNGERAMVIDLDSTDPEGWDEDVSPNADMDYTDAVIYELHVRDLSIDDESGVKEEWQGKFLGLTQTGTTNSEGYSTGLDHIIDLGVTHIHLLPSYDYASIDETMTEEEKAADAEKQFNWGYDPENYNVPEGSYSTNPYDGAVRVSEMKEMVQTLHENNINVIMDVVYNHVYDAGNFCFNEIVPNYFSRTNADGSYSNGSGCGNDTASERAMVRKYIVDSVTYWADEYHIDGFRFDLVGLLDAETINSIVDEVHKTHPDVVFYGEGWTMNTAVEPSDTIMATQANAYATPNFAYFSDTFRDFLKGKNDETSWGYVQNTMDGDPEGTLMSCFKANTYWIQNPTQVINYASCHDNYTLMDKINATTASSTEAERIKMNNLAASIYMLAEGIPLIHAGEEMLRTKVDSEGNIIHNSYNVPDYINSLKWDNLDNADYRDVVDYYSGLIEFRKNHAALRLTTKDEVNAYVAEKWLAENVVMFNISTADIEDEVSDGIVVIFNSNPTEQAVSLYDNGVSEGTWQICINDEDAGTEVLGTVTDGQVTVPAISALVLVKGETVDTDSVYLDNNQVTVTLDRDIAFLAKDGETTLVATVNPANSTLVWTSSDETVATVEDGVVTAVGLGTTTITVSTLHGVTASCEVTVSDNVVAETITLDKTELQLECEESADLTATVDPENTVVKWTSSDEDVVTVDQNGKVTAVAEEGEAVITATTPTGKKATCTVTIINRTISINKESITLEAGSTYTLVATVTPADTNTKVTWTSSDVSVATVDANGKVTAVAAGNATITASIETYRGTISVTCSIQVTAKEDEPGTDNPGNDEPGNDNPGTDDPGNDDSGTDEPGNDNPGTDKPGMDKPGTDKPSTNTPDTDTPGTDNPEKEDVVYVPEKESSQKVNAELEKLIEKIEKNESVKGIISDETLAAIKEALKNNETLETVISVANTKAEKVDDATEELVEKAVKELAKDHKSTIAQYMDINLFIKSSSGDVLGTLNELSEEITLTFEIPDDWKKEGRVFNIIRVHGDKTDVLDVWENADGTLSFKTDRFSIYALVYVDVVNNAQTQPASPTSPATGDQSLALPFFLLAASMVVLSKRKRTIYKNVK